MLAGLVSPPTNSTWGVDDVDGVLAHSRAWAVMDKPQAETEVQQLLSNPH